MALIKFTYKVKFTLSLFVFLTIPIVFMIANGPSNSNLLIQIPNQIIHSQSEPGLMLLLTSLRQVNEVYEQGFKTPENESNHDDAVSYITSRIRTKIFHQNQSDNELYLFLNEAFDVKLNEFFTTAPFVFTDRDKAILVQFVKKLSERTIDEKQKDYLTKLLMCMHINGY
jgi:hypothetical protein